ncbi:C1A family cysteine protease [Deinococcus metalli]|uniref:C1A family cysteine protease n=1 Tax=Deinococcus metalli TaxID=1141878 RepID=A0A7W8NQN6_9DEIO|nr:C1 family peptidase [Deinococcus metalli]MBB5379264.1 C1A family cysteine protease [Deinococcus metalli]GHF66003.1 hypothetical protein GCM10017781_47160 [Deinococcus metalli]
MTHHVTRKWPQLDLRSALPPVRDQGQRGTCMAFAVTAVHEAQTLTSEAGVDLSLHLSEEVLYWGCRQGQPRGTSGASFQQAQAALTSIGQPADTFWPYDDQRDETAASYAPPSGALDPQHCRQATLRSVAFSVDTVAELLAQGYPVAVGIRIGPAFIAALGGQIPDVPDPVRLGGHAIVLVGYDEAARPGRRGEFIIRNSWGSSWGVQGHGFCSGEWLIANLVGTSAWYVAPPSVRPASPVSAL